MYQNLDVRKKFMPGRPWAHEQGISSREKHVLYWVGSLSKNWNAAYQ